MVIVIKFLALTVVLMSVIGCSPQSQVVSRTNGEVKVTVVEVSHFVTQDGLECIQRGPERSKAISCNWEKFNKQKSFGVL